MSIKFLLSILLVTLLPGLSNAQDQLSELDSLHLALKNSPSDTLRMFALDGIASYYVESERDSAMYYCEASIEMAKKLNQSISLANFLLLKSYLVQKKLDFTQSYRLCNEALTILEDDSNDESAFIPKDWSIEPARLRKRYTANVFHQLGNTLVGAGNLQKAIEYFKKAVQVTEELEILNGGMTSNMNIGTSYYKLGQLDSALIYLQKAVNLANSSGWKKYLGSAFEDIGLVYMKKTELDSAKHYFDLALKANKEQNNLPSEISIRNTLADYYKQKNQVDSMYYFASTALQLGYKLNSDIPLSQSAERVAAAWERMGNADSAYAYLAISKKLGDSLSLDRSEKLLQFQNDNFEEQLRLEQEAQESEAAKNKITTTALLAGLGLLSILVFVFYRNNRQKKTANLVLEQAYSNLKSTQAQLIQQEKLASLGQLTAGIAHEIKNPLNFVNNFSEVSLELVEEIQNIRRKTQDVNLNGEADEILEDIKANLEKIHEHGSRANGIVTSMLQHSRGGSGKKEPTDLNALIKEYVNLSFHGMRAGKNPIDVEIALDLDDTINEIPLVREDFIRVIINLCNNAFDAMRGKTNSEFIPDSYRDHNSEFYHPKLTVRTKSEEDRILISVEDNGPGIPDEIKDKILQPFFTTKKGTEGTGLGLSITHDIIKAHGGELRVETKEGEGCEFIIQLPKQVLI